MTILDDRNFEIMCELHEDLKRICDDLGLKTAQDVNDFLAANEWTTKAGIELSNEIAAIGFAESFASNMADRGISATRIGDGEDAFIAADLMVKSFYIKVEELKEVLKKKGKDFDAMPYSEKEREFRKKLTLEDEEVRQIFLKYFLELYGDPKLSSQGEFIGIECEKVEE